MNTKDITIRILRFIYNIISRKVYLNPDCDCNRQSSNDKIYNLLLTGHPCMISRFGSVEINCVNNYLCIHRKKTFINKCIDYITEKTHTPWWNESHFKYMNINAGIFPIGIKIAEKFSERYLKDIPDIDILACHQYYEKFMPLKKDIIKIQLEMLYPFFVDKPWTRILKGKKVLVVHPFEETIKMQYEKREQLFNNIDILPDFKLITLKAVQTIAGNKSEFKDWFEALKYMENQISQIDFDICIIGCGAYGLPLAAHVKRLGKQAIHMGGGTQLLFGILGKRWTEQYNDTWPYLPGCNININYRTLFNKYWQYPLECDIPFNSDLVENGCYWK